ncbi:peptidase domain-containing ABC transporter [Gammaproteobacteria bacterium LSUCC0112]|nr:peptidase domain-containing ABC transporter [Gammaproteobacteria bacterium LSUCC0112]
MKALFSSRAAMPCILQSERAECGLACLVMIASYFGKKIDLNSLRREHAVSGRGANLADILGIAEALSLSARALKLEIEDLKSLQLPAVLHWDMTHFVVLKKVSKKGLTINDPAVGERTYGLNEASRHVTGIAVEFTPAAGFVPQTQILRSKLSDLFVKYPGFNASVIQLLVLSVCLQIVSIGSAFFMQTVIDESLSKQDADVLKILAIGFLLLALTGVVMGFARSQIKLYFSNQLGFQMVGNVFTHMMSLPADFFERRHVGDLVSRFGSIREIRRIISEDLITVVLDGLFAIVTLLVMFHFSPLLASLVLGFVVLVSLLKMLAIPSLQTLQEQLIVAEAKTSTGLMENMRAIQVIKFYCRELPRVLMWRNSYAEQINTQVHLARFTIRLELVFGALFAMENVLIVYLAATQVLAGKISLGFLTAFVALKGNFSSAIRSFIDKLVQIRLVRLQLERVSDITCTNKEFGSIHLPVIRIPVKGKLTLENVSYRYPGSHNPVLQQINIVLEPGEIMAITGPSGAGKSTLLKIMAGLLEPDHGLVKVDDRDIRESGVRLYRDVCAGILQTDQLLSGSILDNITLFDQQADIGRVHHAAQQAHIHDLILSLPMNYNSMIGDMGSMLSAGQAQRILLARAFYKQAKILFLDEATANLDIETERAVIESLRSLNISMVLISHRPEICELASKKLTLNKDCGGSFVTGMDS